MMQPASNHALERTADRHTKKVETLIRELVR